MRIYLKKKYLKQINYQEELLWEGCSNPLNLSHYN